ncbi:hypothetical protein pb186bvf_011121 [Paramecium bursaria]
MYNFSQGKDPYNFDIGSSSKTVPKAGTAGPAKQQAPPAKSTSVPKNQPQPQNKNVNQKPTASQSKDSGKSKNFEPKRLGLKYNPPTIVLEYLQPQTGKLYHHKMKLLKLKPDTPANHALEYLRKKHATFFFGNKMPESQILELIGKLLKRIQSHAPTQSKTQAQQRPATASTNASSVKGKLQKDIDQYNMSDEDTYTQNKFEKQQPVLEDEDDDEDYEMDDDDMTEEQYQMIYKQMGYDKLDLNKMTPAEVQRHKQIMDSVFNKNFIKPGDSNYQYDVQKNFKPSQNNAWDEEDDEDYDIV